MKEKPSYYAILPANVRYDENLKPMEKIMYAEITALSNAYGYCTASNKYFATLYRKKRIATISEWISNLEGQGYIRSELIYKPNSKEVALRKIYPVSAPITEKRNTPYEKTELPITEKRKDNITSVNTTSVNKGQQNDNEIVTDKFKQVFEKDTLDSSKDKKEELYKNSSAYENDIKNIIGTHDIQISTIKKTGKSKQRIKEVVEFAEKNGKNDAWIVWALREDKELIDPKPKTQTITETIMNDNFEWVTVKREVPIHYNGR